MTALASRPRGITVVHQRPRQGGDGMLANMECWPACRHRYTHDVTPWPSYHDSWRLHPGDYILP